jgi:prepilin-type processing-associated H-X9-DG protein
MVATSAEESNMAENENPAEITSGSNDNFGKMIKEKKLYRLSTLSVFFALIGAGCLAASYITAPAILAALLFCSISLICGILSLLKIKEARYALIGLFVSILAVTIAFELPAPGLGKRRSYAYRLVCGTNLAMLGKALCLYAKDHNDMLPPEQWCDDLIRNSNIPLKTFVCDKSRAKRGQSSYAFNKNLIGRKLSEINPNTVMIFETRPGWNQVGGPEILSYQNHKGDGFNILYADCHVCFEMSFVGLRWEP